MQVQSQPPYIPLNHSTHPNDDQSMQRNMASTANLNNSANVHILEEDKQTPWIKRDKDYGQFDKIMCLHEEIKDFYDYVKPTPEEQYMRELVITKITNVVKSIWKEAIVEAFGSYQTGLFLPTSDIDLVIFGKWPTLPLHTMAEALLKNNIADAHNIKVITTARVPIIKLVDKDTEIKVDIGFNQVSGVKGVQLVKQFMNEFPNLKYLTMVLKQFLLQRDLNEVYTGGISSYCLLYLVISFLQLHPRYDARDENANLGVLLIEFFELYGLNFNYHKIGIVIKDGGAYINKHKHFAQIGDVPGYLFIEDPTNLKNDIGKSSYGAYIVKQAFEYAYCMLRAYEFRTRGPQESVLARIVRITDDVVEYRRWIRANYPPPPSEKVLYNAPSDIPLQSYATTQQAIVSIRKGRTPGPRSLDDYELSSPGSVDSNSCHASDEESEDQHAANTNTHNNNKTSSERQSRPTRHHRHSTPRAQSQSSSSSDTTTPNSNNSNNHRTQGNPRHGTRIVTNTNSRNNRISDDRTSQQNNQKQKWGEKSRRGRPQRFVRSNSTR